ncbi:uncharacterized protein LOC101896426 [Musca domestica]|uniref:Actin cytoskeleton-regulatory complex protein PAN1-like n=1 Tax=Musca domestica TaxID=7370 RepID=A0A1I8N7Z0_MUSDO|nr:uncharacterized protein LOC101896426 [Musca domestica]
MRAFIVLSFVAVACAQYNYQPVSSGSDNLAGVNGGLVSPSSNLPSVAAPEIEKEFFTYTANDNDFNDAFDPQQAANNLKKGIRVIFIKGPENKGLEDAAVALAKQSGEQKTAIYVLNKQADIGDLANKLNNLNTGNNQRPEVHFVKYRTPEDAANAQRAIQEQYNGLGGNTRTVNGGVAPVLNFASQAPAASSGSSNYATAPSNSYIPPAAATPSASYIPPAAATPSASYIPPAAATPSASYIPPAAATPSASYIPPAAATPSASYIPPAASEPSSNYIPPPVPVDEPSTNYLPASILRLFRL